MKPSPSVLNLLAHLLALELCRLMIRAALNARRAGPDEVRMKYLSEARGYARTARHFFAELAMDTAAAMAALRDGDASSDAASANLSPGA